MIDFDDLDQTIAFGYKAKAFSDSEVYQNAFSEMYLNLMQGWQQAEEIEERERIYTAIEVLKAIDSNISTYIINGEFAQEEMEKINGK